MNSQDAELTAIVDEAKFRRDYPLLWLITLSGPFLLTIVVLFIVWEFAGRNAMGRLVANAVATFFFFGKFVILGGSEGELLGRNRLSTFIAIVIGHMLGCALMYLGSELITRCVDRDNPMLLVGGIAVIGTMIFLLNHRYRQLKARQKAEVQ